MPTYEYECEKCGHQFEEFQKITAPPIKVCPKCKGKVHRLIGAGAGFLFKGSGFYVTDYRSSEYKKKEKEERGEVSKPESKTEGKKKPVKSKEKSKESKNKS